MRKQEIVGHQNYCAYGSMANMEIKDTDVRQGLGAEAGLIAPGLQGYWINCPEWSTQRRAVIRWRRCYSGKRLVGGEVN